MWARMFPAFAEVLEQERYFEVDKVVQDDLNRSAYYSSNARAERWPGQIL